MSLSSALVDDPAFLNQALKNWSKHGEKNFLKFCSEDVEVCKKKLTDIIIQLAYGEGKIEYIIKIFPEILKYHGENPTFISDIADIFWLVDNLSDGDSEMSKDKIILLISSLKEFFSRELLIERLSEETLESLSLISSKQAFSTKYVRAKTRLFYKQKKFNLLREENEGYAKCISILAMKNIDCESTMSHLRCLIGYFDLDPNRVINLILDSCEYRANSQTAYVELLKMFNPQKSDLSQFVGHKFSTGGSNCSNSLFRLAALLISNNLIDMEQVLSHMNVKDEMILQNYEKQTTLARSYRPVNNTFNTQSASINQSLDHDVRPDHIERDHHEAAANDRHDRDRSHNTPTNNGAIDPSAMNQTVSILEESQVIEDIYNAQIPNSTVNKKLMFYENQKLGLIAALLKFGDWSNAQKLLDRYPYYWCSSYSPVCKALCQLVHHLIENLYEKNNNLTPQLTKQRIRHTKLDYTNPGMTSPMKPVTTFEELGKQVLPIVGYLGPYLSMDINLMVKLCRLGSFFLQNRSEKEKIDSTYQAIFNMLDEAILPSLSLVDSNCCLAEEVWSLLCLMPFDHRYRLYGQWLNSSYSEDPFMIKRKAEVLSKVRAILKRLSKENTKLIGRQLGKLSHSNPCLIFDNILSTLQMFTNLIDPIVDCLKYVSSLSYDVLAYCIISSLASDQNKLEDFQLSQSLQATATFTGLLCKKYQFDLTGIFSYVNTQLCANQSYDLIVLREIILRMTGVDTSEEVTDEQLEAFNGGDLLLQEGGYYSQIRNTRKNASRLADALMQQKLVMPLLIGMSKMRDVIIFLQDRERPIKLTGKLYDQCMGTLVQFITFLNLQISRDDLSSHLMPINEMLFDFHLPPDTTFCLFRTIFEQKVYQTYERECKKNSVNLENFILSCKTVCKEVAEIIVKIEKPTFWQVLKPEIYTIFWCLSLGDLLVPTAAYNRQISILKNQQSDINKHSEWSAAKKKKELDRLQSLIEKLQKEQIQRNEHVKRMTAWLESEKESMFFRGKDKLKSNPTLSFLQACVFPRAFFTSSDAIYAAEFLIFLHKMKTPQFITLVIFDHIFNQMPQLISLATENEAHRFGRFLCTILFYVMHWHSSAKVYNNECANYPGFVTALKKTSSSDSNQSNTLDYESYRHVVHKWHYCLTKFLVSSLESGNSIQIRNSLIVLTRILPHYPKIITFGNALERRLNKLKDDETEKRPDLKALAISCIGLLRPKHSTWIQEKEFHKDEKEGSQISSKGDTKPSPSNNVKPVLSSSNASSSSKKQASASQPQSSSSTASRSRESTANSGSHGHHHHHSSNREACPSVKQEPSRSNNASSVTTITAPSDNSSEMIPIKKRKIQSKTDVEIKQEPNESRKSISPKKANNGVVKKRDDSLTMVGAHQASDVPLKKSRQSSSKEVIIKQENPDQSDQKRPERKSTDHADIKPSENVKVASKKLKRSTINAIK